MLVYLKIYLERWIFNVSILMMLRDPSHVATNSKRRKAFLEVIVKCNTKRMQFLLRNKLRHPHIFSHLKRLKSQIEFAVPLTVEVLKWELWWDLKSCQMPSERILWPLLSLVRDLKRSQKTLTSAIPTSRKLFTSSHRSSSRSNKCHYTQVWLFKQTPPQSRSQDAQRSRLKSLSVITGTITGCGSCRC